MNWKDIVFWSIIVFTAILFCSYLIERNIPSHPCKVAQNESSFVIEAILSYDGETWFCEAYKDEHYTAEEFLRGREGR